MYVSSLIFFWFFAKINDGNKKAFRCHKCHPTYKPKVKKDFGGLWLRENIQKLKRNILVYTVLLYSLYINQVFTVLNY